MAYSKSILTVSVSPRTITMLDTLAQRYAQGNRSAMVEWMLTNSALQLLEETVKHGASVIGKPGSTPPTRRRSGTHTINLPPNLAVPQGTGNNHIK